jgi:hypothetical protein
LDCDPGGGDGGGGGGGGTSAGGGLGFLGASNSGLVIGGVSGREGPGVAAGFVPNQISYVYTAPNDPIGDQYNDQYVYYGATNQQPQRIVPQSGEVFSDANPALQVVTVPGAPPVLYLAINSNQNPAYNYGGFSSLFIYDGANWNLPPSEIPSSIPFTQYSPSLTASSQYLFTGLTNAADHTLVICRTDITVQGGGTDCTNFPGSWTMNFNPALAYWNGVLYIGFEEYDNTHALRLFTSTDNGQTINQNTQISNVNEDTTSMAPSLIVANNALYVGFRSNDGGHNFLYRYSTDGINFSVRQGTGESMNSGPAFVISPYNNTNYLYNYYTSDDGNHTLVINEAPVQ